MRVTRVRVRHLVVLCAAALLIAAPADAQVRGAVTGRVVAGTSGEPLNGATVKVTRAGDTTAVAAVPTDAAGRFRADGLTPGRYAVSATFLGYTQATVDSVDVPAAAVDVGTIRLEVAPVELDAVRADAERAPVQILTDRTIYTTKDMPASTGGTATDLLRSVPELDVDINGKVTLRGNQSVSIHLNGRPAPMTGDALANFLQQMPADRIAKIEVMPNPTAKHDPEGTGGIVNIILKDNVDLGLSGNVTARYGTRGSRGFNGRLAYQKGRITFFGGVGVNSSDNTNDTFDVRRNLLADPITTLEQEGRSTYDYAFNMLDLTTEVKVAERTTAWFSAMAWGGGNSNNSAMLYGLYDDGRIVLDRYDRITDSNFDNGSTDFAVGLKHVFEPQRHELTLDIRRNGYGTDGTQYSEKLSRLDPTLPLSEVRSTENDNDNEGTTVRLDYTRPLGEKGKIDAGLNIGRRSLDESSIQQVFLGDDTDPSDRNESLYVHHEDFNSAYVTAAQTFGDFGIQLGLRAELAETRFTLRTTGEDFDNDYRTLFPSMNLSWTMGEGKSLRLNYSKRISRPYAGLLNPYRPSDDPLNRQIGNPLLEPSYTHSVGLDFSRIGKLGTLRIAPFWRRTVNGWESIKRVDENGVSTVTWENTASTESLGSTVTASVRPIGRFNGSVSSSIYRATTDASNISPEYSRESWRWSLGTNVTAKITETLNAQMSANYSPAREVPQGRISSIFFSNISLRQQLLERRATVSLFVTDPFDLYHYRFETSDRTHVQSGRTSFSQRMATLSITWNFGKPPERASREGSANAGSDDTVRIR